MPRDYRAVKAERASKNRPAPQGRKPKKARLTPAEIAEADARSQHFQNVYRIHKVHEAALRAQAREASNAATK